MTPHWTLALNLLFGLLLGTAYFATLRWSTDRFARGCSTRVALGLILARFVVLAAALALVSQQGALALLSTTLGVLIARAVVLRRARTAMT